MPGHDDTLNDGGPAAHDILDDLCTCGHRLGDHHTIDEACLQDDCACAAFQWTGGAFGHSEPTPEQIRARLDAHAGDSMGTLDQSEVDPVLAGHRDALDDMLHASQLCTDGGCGHRREQHGKDDEEGCTVEDCECPAFLEEPTSEFDTVDAREVARIKSREGPPNTTRNNTREAVDRPMTHDERSAQMDREPMSPVESMSADERRESDAVRSETLDNLCTCGHRYGDHWTVDDSCAARDCVCEVFDALLKPVDPVRPFRTTRCAGCGHEEDEHAANATVCHVEGCECQAFIEYTSAIDHEKLERDRRLPYTPPLLRKRFIGEDELRKVLQDAGRLDLLAQLPEVDRVTTNYDAEHWSEIERLARFPQGSSETTVSRERTTKAIATALLELRQCLGVTDYTERLVKHIEANAAVIHETAVLLDRITSRLPQTGEDT